MVSCDFDMAVIQKIEKIYSEATINLCLFHLYQSVRRKLVDIFEKIQCKSNEFWMYRKIMLVFCKISKLFRSHALSINDMPSNLRNDGIASTKFSGTILRCSALINGDFDATKNCIFYINNYIFLLFHYNFNAVIKVSMKSISYNDYFEVLNFYSYILCMFIVIFWFRSQSTVSTKLENIHSDWLLSLVLKIKIMISSQISSETEILASEE